MNKKVKIVLIVAAVIILAEVVTISALLVVKHNTENSYEQHLELAQKYLEDGDYEGAIAEFEAAIEIKAKQADAYTGLADVYIAMGDYEAAVDILNDGYEATGEKTVKRKLASARELMEEAMAEVASVGEGENVAENNEDEEQEYDYNQMAEAGDYSFLLEGEMLDLDEWTINGTPVKDSTFDDWWSAYPKQNSSYDEYNANESYSSNGFWAHTTDYGRSQIGIEYVDNGYQPELRNIQMGENMGSVLKKLGFSDEGILFIQEWQDEIEDNVEIGMDGDEASENYQKLIKPTNVGVNQDNTAISVEISMRIYESELADVYFVVRHYYFIQNIEILFRFVWNGDDMKLDLLGFTYPT